jgi:hypothetical protein
MTFAPKSTSPPLSSIQAKASMAKLRSLNSGQSCKKPVKDNFQLRYIISPTAIHDLNDIDDYFAEYNIDAGEQFLDEFSKK